MPKTIDHPPASAAPMDHYFTYAGLLTLLQKLNTDFGCFTLSNRPADRGIILRHDVDLDVQPAYDLAEREAASNISGTYFFLITSDLYNVQSITNRNIIRKIHDLGFEIGLHFDPLIYASQSVNCLEDAARREAKQLEDIISDPVRSISLHNPSISNHYPLFPGWVNAYDPAIFSPDIYLSDSRMFFRSDPALFFEKAHSRVCQFLLHPMHYAESPCHYPTPMVNYILRRAEALDTGFRANTTYRKRVGGDFFRLLSRAVEAVARR